MSKKNVFDNIMNYFNDEEEEEEEDEEEGNYIPNYNKNNKKNVNKKKGTSLKELNSSLTINNPEDEEEKIINKDNNINNDNNNNFYSYLSSNSSRPDTPKLNENKIKEEENINEKKRDENKIKNEDNNDIFSETIKTKLKDINSNIISLEDNNNILESYDESVNSRQTFFKNENINENQKINSKESQKDIPINEKEDISKNKKELKDEKKIIDSNIEIKNNELNLNEEKNKEEENNIKIENNKNNNNINLKNNINNEYSDMIRRNKLSIELQKKKEKLRQIENLNIENNLNENMEKIINKEKEEFSNNNFNNINYLNFKDMKEIYKDDYIDKEKEKEKDLNKKAINEKEIIIKKENEDLINNINSNNIDNLFIPIMNNNIIENEIKKNRNKLKKFNKDKKQLTKSKSSEQFNTKFNISKSSFKWLSSYNEKLISKIILKNSDKNKQISILGIIKTLHTLKILHNLLSKNKLDLNNLNENVQKQKEVDFVEQIWFLLNPNNKKVINNEIFECFIKLLFPYTNNLKQSAIEYIEEYIKIINFMEPKNDIKNDEYFYSPLRNEYFPKNKKWSTEKIIQTFFELKRNIISYKKNFEKINNEENKNNENKKKKRTNLNFDELYESFMIKKEARKKTLNIMREEQEKEKEEIISKYTYIPKIIKNKENKWKNIYDNNNNNNKSVYDKLYERRKDKEKKIKKLKDKFNKYDIENKKIEKYSFKPEINNFENSKKQFEKNDIPDNCKKYIKKNLEIIKRKKELKLEEENKYNGTNYEKIRKIKFKCKGPLYEPKKIYKNEKINKEIKINDKNNFTVKIKLPNKKDINLTVNINENIKQKVEKLCKIYSLDNNIKEKIINQIESYKEIYNQEGHN